MTGEIDRAIATAPMFGGLDQSHVEYLAAQSRPIVLPAVLTAAGVPVDQVQAERFSAVT